MVFHGVGVWKIEPAVEGVWGRQLGIMGYYSFGILQDDDYAEHMTNREQTEVI